MQEKTLLLRIMNKKLRKSRKRELEWFHKTLKVLKKIILMVARLRTRHLLNWELRLVAP